VAVPVFKEIADRVYASDISIHSKDTDTIVKYSAYQYGYLEDLKEILRTMGYRAAKSGTEWASMTLDTEMNTNINESIPPGGRVPNLKGLGLRDAIYMAESAGMSVRANGKGKVIQQQPEPGSQITTNRISVTLQ
jgi:cell division protein FtsI (penicillin-binding protein 3)